MQYEHMNQKISVGTAEILGAFIGDGWIETSLNGFYITGDRIEDKDYYDTFLAPLFSEEFSSITPKEFSYWKVYGIGCYRREIIRKCVDLGFQTGKKSLVAKIPDYVMNYNDNNVTKALLRGIFDADGSFWCERSRAKTSIIWKRKHHYHPEMQIGSCSKTLLEQIKILLEKLNIHSKIVMKAKKGIKCNRNINDFYALRIRRMSDIKRWFAIIGSSNPRHQTRHLVWKQFGFLPPRTNINQRKEMLNGKLDPNSFYE